MTIEAISEEWRDIAGYEGIYQVSDLGRVKSFRKWRSSKERILKGYPKNDYPVVSLKAGKNRKESYVHRLVAVAFLGVRSGMEVNHKDGCRTNNNLNNLEWVSHSENISHAYMMGKCDRKHLKAHLPFNAMPVIAIKDTAILEFPSVMHCAEYIGARDHTVRRKMDLNKEVNGHLIYSL